MLYLGHALLDRNYYLNGDGHVWCSHPALQHWVI